LEYDLDAIAGRDEIVDGIGCLERSGPRPDHKEDQDSAQSGF